MNDWDPGQYLRFEEARLAPAMELLERVEVEAPSCVVDAGCGPANVAPFITARWPNARYVGVDSSSEMIARAVAAFPEQEWVNADLATWQPDVLVDVLYSNATLHWLDDHPNVFPGSSAGSIQEVCWPCRCHITMPLPPIPPSPRLWRKATDRNDSGRCCVDFRLGSQTYIARCLCQWSTSWQSGRPSTFTYSKVTIQ